MFIIIGIITGLLVLFAEQMLNGGPRIGDEDESWFSLSRVDASGWFKAALSALICGAAMFCVPKLSYDSPALVAFYIAFAVMLMALCREWHYNESSDLSELVPFLILTGIFGALLLHVESWMAFGIVAHSMMHWFAWGLTALTLGYIIVRHLRLNHELVWLMPAFAIIALVAFVWTGVLTGTQAAAMAKLANEEEQELADTTAEETVTPGEDSRFVQEWTSNENNRLDNDFSAKLAEKAKAEDGEITADIVEEAVLENCGHDARLLAIWANAFGLWDDPNDYDELLTNEGTYLSDEGIQLYHKLEGYLAAVEVVRDDAPADGTNTGYDDGFVVSGSSGITGDRSGTRFTSPDKEVEQFWLMDRCSNLVYKNPPDHKKGKTDEPEPEPEPEPKYNKDPNKAPKKNTEPNDDKGPGENTNNKKDPQHSTKDTKDSTSNSGKTSEEVKKDQEEKAKINQDQKTGKDNNNASTPAPSKDTKVDNNGDKGTGNGGINTPTPTKDKAKEADTGKTINDKAGEEWGGPSD